MTGQLLERPPRELAPAGRYPGAVLAGQVARRAARSGALWGLIFGFFVIVQTLAYTSTYKTQASRDQLARAFGSNIGHERAPRVGPRHQHGRRVRLTGVSSAS